MHKRAFNLTYLPLLNLLQYFPFIAFVLLLSSCGGNSDSGNTNTTDPNTPLNLQITKGDGVIKVSWDKVNNAAGYFVYWNTAPGVTKSDNFIYAWDNFIVHSGLTNGTTYYYSVSSTVNYKSSDLSAEVSISPEAATSMTLTNRTSGVSDNLATITTNGSVYVASGGNGSLVSSDDANSWTVRDSGTSEHLFGSASDGTNIVVVGNQGTIITSPDGSTWTSRTSGTTGTLKSIVWASNQYVAVGTTGTSTIVLTSPDGIDWTSRSTGKTYTLNDVIWTGTQLVAVGNSGAIMTSSDGITWDDLTSVDITDNFNQIAFDNHQYVAVTSYNGLTNGFTRYSPDLINWTGTGPLYIGNPIQSVAWNGHQFIRGIGSGYLDTSSFGVNWTSSATATDTVLDILWSNNRYIIVGNGGMIATGTVEPACTIGTYWNGVYCQ